MPQSLALDVCKTGILKTLQDSFTNRTTFINEALQNSRRAGATQIDLTFNPDTFVLTIADNGCGMTDFTDLLTIGQSGWDPAILETEHPFGVGAAAMLFAADHITIVSHQQRLHFSTKSILLGTAADLEDTHEEAVAGTMITLTLKPDLFHDLNLETQLHAMVKGFPLPVTWNGQPLPRPHAVTSDFVATAIGPLWIGSPRTLLSTITLRPTIYLQGFPLETGYLQHDDTIVHLDSAQFRARVPDRTQLIDDPTYAHKKTAAISEAVRHRLLALMTSCTPLIFVDTYATTCWQTKNDDLLNNLPLPLDDCSQMTDIPISLGYGEESEYLALPPLDLRPTDPKGPLPHPITTTRHISWDEDSVAGAYALAGDYLIINDHALSKDHWLSPHVTPLSDYHFTVEPINPRTVSRVDTYSCFGLTLIICDGFTITPSSDNPLHPILPPLTLTTHFLFSFAKTTAYFPLPAIDRDGSYWNLLRQIDDYYDEHDQYNERSLEDDETLIRNLIMMARHNNPTTLLMSVLRTMPVAYTHALRGHHFLLHIQDDRTISLTPQTTKGSTP